MQIEEIFRTVHVGFLMAKVAQGQVFLWVRRFSPTNYQWSSASNSPFITLNRRPYSRRITGCSTKGLSLIPPPQPLSISTEEVLFAKSMTKYLCDMKVYMFW